MERDLAVRDPSAAEQDYALEFEEPAFLTLGLCYEENGRFSGGAYHPVLKKVDEFFDAPLPKSIVQRGERASKVLELDRAVTAAVAALKERGLQSPYLRAFVVARVNPLRFHKGPSPGFDATISKMLTSARNFKAGSIKMEQLARTGGAPEE